MPNRSADPLFQLIHSLEKSEKRAFKLYIKRNSPHGDLKIVQLFDVLEKINEYNDTLVLKRIPSIKKQQLSNLKAHLYKELLSSLRLLKNNDDLDIQLHEQLDYARILYNKGLYLQSLKILERIKELALSFNQDSFLIRIISLEKKIETLHITRSLQNRAEELAAEANGVAEKRIIISKLSNLALQLYGWYIKNGHARNEKDEEAVKTFFRQHLPPHAQTLTGFYERLYFFQSYCWLGFIRQDFLMYYRYTQKWVQLFTEQPQMISVETAHYIKGLHNLLNAHFDLRNYAKFEATLTLFEDFSRLPVVTQNKNNEVQTFVYLSTARINQHFLLGTFQKGVTLIPQLEEKLNEYYLFLDRHRILVFYYKIASLYFGNGNWEKCIDYLQKIINWKVDLRNDLQCYARLLHLLAHYELRNFDIMEHLTKSVYRFMAKMENLTVIEEEMFRFIKNNFNASPQKLQPQFEKLLTTIKQYENSRFESRAFAYLDIISWLESKVSNKSISQIIQEKYRKSKRSLYFTQID